MEIIKRSPLPSLNHLVDLIHSLSGKSGCPWDKAQTPSTIARYLVEEAHELAETIASGDHDEICSELGDVLFHIVFLAHLYGEAGQFCLADIIDRNVQKMVRRHPHVFGDHHLNHSDEIRAQWHRIKKAERQSPSQFSVLDSVPAGLPALMRAYRISERAAGTGFDWDNLEEVLEKAEEEWGEFKAALMEAADADVDPNKNAEEVQIEFGDMIFTLTNVARLARFHPETATAAAIRKFEKRFRWMEQNAADNGTALEDIPRDELERLWHEAKERISGGSE